MDDILGNIVPLVHLDGNLNSSGDQQTVYRGYSAYQVALQQGFEGSKDEWLRALVGPQGETGVSISDVRLNDDFTLTVTLDDGTEFTTDPIKGDKGDKGQKGDKGDKGDTGPAGATGPQGPQGQTGPKGDKGNTGEQGPKGDPGEKGQKGDTGQTGATGPQGPQGPQGETGAAFTYDDFTPEQLELLRGPRGQKGQTGQTGPQGLKGDTGQKGEKGDTGSQGPKGDSGPKGDKGQQGIQGQTGKTGAQGQKGETGDSGVYIGTDEPTDENIKVWISNDSSTDSGTVESLVSDVSELKEDLSDYTNTTYADLLMGKTPTASKYINGTTGEASTIADFCTYSLIDVEDLVGKVLYPRSDDSVVYNTAVSIAFYSSENETSEARTGGSGYSQALHNNGIKVPVDTKYMSVCFNSLRATEMYCGLNPDNINTYALNSQVKVNSSQIVNGDANKMANNIRFPAICFEFDDGHANDADIVDIFTAKGVTCAFALISNTTHANHLTYQNQGFEILSHSTDGTGMNDATVEESTIETKLKTSLEALEAEGFVVKGFVTPNTNMNSKFKPLLRKYYQFATTDMLGTYTGEQIPFMSPVNGIYNGFRVSLQTTTLEKQKEAVDKCIENYGCLVFSGHSAELDGSSYLTTTNLNELLTYINTQVSNGKCIIGNPSDVIIPYFATRNDDVSDGWISVTAEEADLDSRFTADRWAMSYNPKLKLFHFAVRLYPNQDITAQIYPLFKQPVPLVLSDLVMSELGRNCFMYDNGLLIEAGTAWTNGTKKRFSAMMRMR